MMIILLLRCMFSSLSTSTLLSFTLLSSKESKLLFVLTIKTLYIHTKNYAPVMFLLHTITVLIQVLIITVLILKTCIASVKHKRVCHV